MELDEVTKEISTNKEEKRSCERELRKRMLKRGNLLGGVNVLQKEMLQWTYNVIGKYICDRYISLIYCKWIVKRQPCREMQK